MKGIYCLLTLLLSSCSLQIKHQTSVVGNNNTELSLSIAPIIRMERIDELHTGDKHKQIFFGTAPQKQTSSTPQETITEQ